LFRTKYWLSSCKKSNKLKECLALLKFCEESVEVFYMSEKINVARQWVKGTVDWFDDSSGEGFS